MASIYEYTDFYKNTINNALDKTTEPTYDPAGNNKYIYDNNNEFRSSANRGNNSSTAFINSDKLLGGQQVNSTQAQQYYSRFKNLAGIEFARYKAFQSAGMGLANIENANSSEFKKVDAQWVSSRFMTPNKDLSEIDRQNRFFSSTGWKFQSTRLGFNAAMNARPQFTRTADIRGNNRVVSGIGGFNSDKGVTYGTGILNPEDRYGLGMGRYYSEAIDDNATQIYLQFGVPKFNSLINYFINAVSYEDSYIATYGRLPTGFKMGQIIGGFVIWCAFPLITTTIWIAKAVLQLFFGGPFNFYYMEPTMYTYWASVNMLVSSMAAELGIIAPVLMQDQGEGGTNGEDELGAKTKILETGNQEFDSQGNVISETAKITKTTGNETTSNKRTKMGVPVRISSTDIKELARYMPGMIDPTTAYIDVFKIAMHGQSLQRYLAKLEYQYYYDHGTGKSKNNQIKNGWIGDGKGGFMGIQSEWMHKLDSVISFQDWLGGIFNSDKQPNEVKDMFSDTTLSKTYPETNGKKRDNSDENPNPFYAGAKGQTVTIEDKTAKETGKEEKSEKKTTEIEAGSGTQVESDEEDGILTGAASWLKDGVSSWFENFGVGIDSAIRDGGAWAVLNVDYQGSVSDSISSSVSQVEAGGLTKQVGQAVRNAKFNFANGNLIPGLDQITGALKSFAMGVLDSVSFGFSNVVASLLGGGYVDMPKKWDDSDFSFPSVTYNMTLVSPYGNPISQLQNIYIPLAMILAGSLPLKAGEASYTSPFLCSLFNKGIQDIKMGMITSVNITRGITNLPYSRNKRMLSCEVSFSVTDFSTRVVAPLNSSLFKTVFSTSFDDQSPTGIYIATLASRDLFTNKYTMPRIKIKLARIMTAFSQSISPYGAAMKVAGPDTLMNNFFGLFVFERRLGLNQLNP